VEVLGSERLTGAVLDRLTHRCHILEMNGESYRLRDAKRRRGLARSEPGESPRSQEGMSEPASGCAPREA
jgi:hypothetical protein